MDRELALWLCALFSAPFLYLTSELILYGRELVRGRVMPEVTLVKRQTRRQWRRKALAVAVRMYWRQIFCVLFMAFMLGAFASWMIVTAFSFDPRKGM